MLIHRPDPHTSLRFTSIGAEHRYSQNVTNCFSFFRALIATRAARHGLCSLPYVPCAALEARTGLLCARRVGSQSGAWASPVVPFAREERSS